MEENKRERSHFDDEIFFINDWAYYRGTPPGAKKRREAALGLKKGALQKDLIRRKKEVLEGLSKVGSKTGRNSFNAITPNYIKDRTEEAKDPTILSAKSLYETESLIKNHLSPFLGSTRIEEIDQPLFNNYCALKKKAKLNLANHRKVLNHFLKWCVSNGYLKYRPELSIPKSAIKPRRSRVVLTNDEILRLLKALKDNATERPLFEKHLLYVSMYLLMGMRNMEICKLRWDQINFELRSLAIDKMSNRKRKERVIPINPYVLETLQKRHAKRTSAWVFPSVGRDAKKPYMDPSGGYRKGWVRALDRAKLNRHITPHDLRATFETFMHTNLKFTDTQREKMAGAAIDVQKNIYVTMNVDHLRGLEESVNIPEIAKIFGEKIGENEKNSRPSKPAKVKKHKGIRK